MDIASQTWAAIAPKGPHPLFVAHPDPSRGGPRPGGQHGPFGRLRGPFGSPVFVLAEHISCGHASSALEILRQPILVPEPLSLAEWALIKVCCKRFRVQATNPDARNDSNINGDANGIANGDSDPLVETVGPQGVPPTARVRQLVEQPLGGNGVALHLDPEEFPRIAPFLGLLLDNTKERFTLSAREWMNLLDDMALALGPGRVGAALAHEGPKGLRVDRIAFNAPHVGHILHAEYLLLRAACHHSLFIATEQREDSQSETPTSVTFLSTRKPCRMCAALILETIHSQDLKIHYRHFDPGPMAAKTVLNAQSFDRTWMPHLEGELEEPV